MISEVVEETKMNTIFKERCEQFCGSPTEVDEISEDHSYELEEHEEMITETIEECGLIVEEVKSVDKCEHDDRAAFKFHLTTYLK